MRRCRSSTSPSSGRSNSSSRRGTIFPCLRLAYRALEAERSLPIVLNAANEVAVSSFLEGRLGFTQIPQVIAQAMDAHTPEPAATLADVRRVDAWARMQAAELARELELDVRSQSEISDSKDLK